MSEIVDLLKSIRFVLIMTQVQLLMLLILVTGRKK